MLAVTGLELAQGESFTLGVKALELGLRELVCLTGPSGSGKSTLLDTIALLSPARRAERVLFRPDPGGVALDLAPALVAGRLDALAAHRSGAIGYAPQAGGMLPFLAAWDDATSAAALSGHAGGDTEARVRRFAGELRLDGDLGKSRSALSGGQRKRLSLLRALARPRRLFVLDEPTAGLDDATAVTALSLVARVAREEGAACLIASHDTSRAEAAGFAVRSLHSVDGGMNRFELAMPARGDSRSELCRT
ncbi:ATP-binding cassette domain-containing protein [Rhodosalinus sediminis]|uniref:ATP-binding cassette domain-containing protein n=1 Tax=Rhodosalinus sediminis TaxID=1940533 RepID=UPI002353B1C8|nr:ATP-binding cassette domain-containing protein [Rhodosalinus sediminis]